MAAEKKHHVLGNHGIALNLIGIDVNEFSNKRNARQVRVDGLVALVAIDEQQAHRNARTGPEHLLKRGLGIAGDSSDLGH